MNKYIHICMYINIRIYTICQFLSSIIHTKLTTIAGPRVQLQFPCVPLPCFQRRTCHKVMQISLSNISFLETQSILMFDAVKRHPAIGEYNCKFIAVMKPLPTDMQQVLTSSEKRIPMLKITVCSMLGQLPQTLWMNDPTFGVLKAQKYRKKVPVSGICMYACHIIYIKVISVYITSIGFDPAVCVWYMVFRERIDA